MGFLDVAADLVKGVVKVGGKVGGAAFQAIKRGIAKRKDKKAAKKAGLDPVKDLTGDLIDGTTKYYRDLVNKQKDKARAIDEKIKFYKKLIKEGATESEAKRQVGLTDAEMNLPATFWTGTEGENDEVTPEPEPSKIQAAKGCMVTTILLLSSVPFLTVVIIILIKLI